VRIIYSSTPLRKAVFESIISTVTRFRWCLLIVAVALAGSGWIYLTRVPDAADVTANIAAHVNFRAPEFTLAALDGKPVALTSLRGKVVLVNFWATWCPPCRIEMPEIQSAYQAHRDDLVVLAVNQAEDDDSVKRFVDEFHLTILVLLDRDQAIGRRFQVLALPTSFFIDREGVIRAVRTGQMDRAYIEAQLSALSAAH
jgi:cytochrome c biogenesis protein CcmG/thiol:disulfide interchange protein DsbE